MTSSFDDAVAAVDRPQLLRASGEELEFWRKADPTFDEFNKIIAGGMFPHQRDWWGLDNFVKLLLGGYGAGKTLAGSKKIIASALENAPVPVCAVSPTFPLARRTTISTIAELLEGKRAQFGRRFWWNYNATSHEFHIRFKGRDATIIIYSGERPLSLRGPNLGAAWLDEPFIMEYEVFEQMYARVRHPEARAREIFMTGTPEQLNWGYDIVTGELSEEHDVGVVVGSSRANKALPADWVKRLEKIYSEKAAAAYIEGQFVNLTEGLVYYGFNPDNNVIRFKEPMAGAQWSSGMDFNVDPMSACVGWYVPGRHLHIENEYELPNSDTQDMCQVLRQSHGWDLQEICPDVSGKQRHSNAPGGKSDYDYIRAAGYELDAGTINPAIRDRYNAVNGLLRATNGRIRLTVDPRCKKLIKYMTLYSHKNKRKQDDMSHLLDALGYLVFRKFPVGKDLFTLTPTSGH
tara:strand:- start:5468 stop:6850 length:1383 start_codon:yes stop_codon:yes gene_type:complete